jgi:aminoglycoside 6'-N-acetyltransferase
VGARGGGTRRIEDVLARLQGSAFRRRFRLSAEDRAYVHEKGRATIARHAADFVARRLAPARIANDGKQTPMRGHPVFLAQHATATCCRGSLAKWHGIAAGHALSEAEQAHVLAVIGRWIDRQMASALALRRATPDDLATLLRWDEEPDVAASGGDDDVFDWAHELPREVDWRELLIGEADGRPIGFVQIVDCAREETHYWGTVEGNLRAIDVWIGAAADRSHGLGTRMMQLAVRRCFADPGVEAVLVDPLAANTRAHAFYERLGFIRVERRRFGCDDCYVYRLERGT